MVSYALSPVVIILCKRVCVGLYFLPILWKTSFTSFCALSIFCFESNVLNQDLNIRVILFTKTSYL